MASYTLVAEPANYGLSEGGGALDLLIAASGNVLVLTGEAALLNAAFLIAAANGSYSIAGQAAATNPGVSMGAAFGAYTLAGQTATETAALSLSLSHGSYALTGQVATLAVSHDHVLTAVHGSYSVTLKGGSLDTFKASSGAVYTVTGIASSTTSHILTASYGTYSVSLFGGTLDVAIPITAVAYSLVGEAATFTHNAAGSIFSMSASAGSFGLSGQSVSWSHGIDATTGTYAFTGLAATLSTAAVYVLGTTPGIFSANGQAVTFPKVLALPAAYGAFLASGISANQLIDRITSGGTFLVTGSAASLVTATIDGHKPRMEKGKGNSRRTPVMGTIR